MKLRQAFNNYAQFYDQRFTYSLIGAAQRNQVWKYLDGWLKKPCDILEVNCGTGHDALKLAGDGHSVLATDLSDEMIQICKKKQDAFGKNFELTFIRSSFHELEDHLKDRQFDLILSNFGGLNCISREETSVLVSRFSSLLKPRGILFLVYMNRVSLWSWFYRLIKGKGKDFRNHEDESRVKAFIQDQAIDIWYYSIRELKHLYGQHFKYLRSYPIGFFVPPTFMEPFINRHAGIFPILDKLDGALHWLLPSTLADHFAIVFRKR